MPYTATTVEFCETTWDEIAPVAGVTLNTDAADYKEGTKSTTIAPDGTVADGTLMAAEDTSALTPDLSSCHRLRFWIKSSVDTAAGDLQILLDAHANCASPEETLDVPALTAATWAYVTVSLADPASDGAIISIGLKYTLNAQACTIKIDAVYGDAMTPEYQKRQIVFGGNVYSKTMTMANDNATRFETTVKKLRDVVIIVKTHPMLLGETGVEVYPVAADETVGFTKVDISTLYFKNAGAGNNGVITILGTEE